MEKYFKIFKYHGGGIIGLKRVWDTITEVDLFDFYRRGVETSKIKTNNYANDQYMFYAPVYSSVSKEMLRLSFDYYTSAVRYTNYQRKTIFIDLGCGAGKTIIQAGEMSHFDFCGGVEVDKELVSLSLKNYKAAFGEEIKKNTINESKGFVFHGEVETDNWTIFLEKLINEKKLNKEDITLFIFNKNSYGENILRESLEISSKYFSSIFYLYQNPIHEHVLKEKGFKCFLSDSLESTAHKNFKYKCYFRHKIT